MNALTADGLLQPAPADAPHHSHSIGHFILVDAPYIAMLVMALGGIAYRAFIGHPILLYWLFLMPVFGGLCIIAGLAHAQTKDRLVTLIWTQILHWAAFLAAMYLITLKPVQMELNDNAIALLQLTLLALGVFVAGVHATAWRICVVGIVLAAAVPAVAWVNASGTLILLCVITLVLVLVAFWLVRRRVRRFAAEHAL
jgi:hypothetical protein